MYSEYDSLPGIRWSLLKTMLTSPMHYRHALTHPREDTPAMLLGRAVHMAVLEPDRFPLEFAVYDGARRGSAWTEFAAANAARDILTVPEYERALAIRDAVRGHRLAASLLATGTAEQTVTWTDDGTGLDCKARIDHYAEPAGKRAGAIVDLKTTRDITPRAFARTCDHFRYASQLAYYADGVRAAYGEEAHCYFVAVESDAPHDVAVYRIGSDDLWRGSDEAHALLERVAECTESGEWPGAYPERLDLELPAWTWGEDTDLSDLVAFGG